MTERSDLTVPSRTQVSQRTLTFDDFSADDVARREAASHTVLCCTASRFATTVKTGDHFACHIDNLVLTVNTQARIRIMCADSAPCGIERSLLDLVTRLRFVKVLINSLLNKSVVACDRFR